MFDPALGPQPSQGVGLRKYQRMVYMCVYRCSSCPKSLQHLITPIVGNTYCLEAVGTRLTCISSNKALQPLTSHFFSYTPPEGVVVGYDR